MPLPLANPLAYSRFSVASIYSFIRHFCSTAKTSFLLAEASEQRCESGEGRRDEGTKGRRVVERKSEEEKMRNPVGTRGRGDAATDAGNGGGGRYGDRQLFI